MPPVLTWILIGLCLTQSAMFSGLNLALFSWSRLNLESEVAQGNKQALIVLRLRLNANLLLCTILWGNVSVNVLLALLSDSVMAGIFAFVFSTLGITLFGEIMPQAWFSRHALQAGSALAPLIRFYQYFFYPLAKPSSLILDKWIGPEGPNFLREEDFEVMLARHIDERTTDISHAEGRGALNFLRLDDLRVSGEGSSLDPKTILPLPFENNRPALPLPDTDKGREFIDRITRTEHRWIVLVDEEKVPVLVLDANDYTRAVRACRSPDPLEFTHRPIVVTNPETPLDEVLTRLVVEAESFDDQLVDREVILYWGERSKRIITGPDLLGRLLHGIAQRRELPPQPQAPR